MFSLSSIYRKLHTNARLTYEEEVEVRRTMGETWSRLRAVESEIARLQHRLVVLGREGRDTQKVIEIHSGFLSPVRQLAPEILQEIFWQCLPTAHNSVLSVREAPLVFGRVCSRWHQVAYSTPKLWSSLHIAIAPLDPRGRARLEAIDAWLTRSGILPLSISMCTYNESDDTTSYPPYFNLILKYAKRWKRVHLEVDPCDPMDFLAEITVDDFPLLEVFHLRQDIFETACSRVDSLGKKDGILFVPSLRALSIEDISVRLPDLPIQFRLLTDLSLGVPFLDTPDIFKVLRHCSNLETLVVTLGLPWSPTSISQSSGSWPLIVLPKLQTLKVYGQFGNLYTLLALLDNLSTPALRHFAYRITTIGPECLSASLTSFHVFFQRLNEPLQELDLLADDLDTSYVIEFLYLFPGLKRLSLRYPPHILAGPPEWLLNEHLLPEFIPRECGSCCQSRPHQIETHDSILPSFGCLCPNLEVLDINRVIVSKRVLLEHLRARLVDHDKYNIARLRNFSISFSLMPRDEVMAEEVEQLSEESCVPMEFKCFPPALDRPDCWNLTKPSLHDGILQIFGVQSS